MCIEACGVVCHSKCAEKLPKPCAGRGHGNSVLEVIEGPSSESSPKISIWLMDLVPSMFGRELSEQVAADKTPVPVIVTKSISAVEAVGE